MFQDVKSITKLSKVANACNLTLRRLNQDDSMGSRSICLQSEALFKMKAHQNKITTEIGQKQTPLKF